MARAVAGREHVGVRGPRMRVDADAVRAFESRRGRELDVWHDPDADDHDVARETASVRDLHALDASPPNQRADVRSAMDLHAGRAMQLGVERGHLRTHDASEHALRGLEHRDLEAAPDRDRGDLEPDVAAADHDDARAGRELRVDRVDVGDRAHVMHALERGAGCGEPAHAAAGREQQAVVAQRAAVVEAQRVRAAVELLDAAPEL